MKITLATTSFTPVYSKEANLQQYFKYIDKAAEKNARLIVFPEQSLQAPPRSFPEVTEEDRIYQLENAELIPEGASTQLLIGKAKEKNMYIVWSMTERESEKLEILYNTAVLVGPEGYVGKYRKVHQTAPEKPIYRRGHKFSVFDTEIGKIGLMICYDKAFPESARELYAQCAEIIAMPSAWPVGSNTDAKDDNDMYLGLYNMYDKVRSAENTVFFLSSNQIGKVGDVYYCGHSRITRPTPIGEEAACTGWEEGIVFAEAEVQKEIEMYGRYPVYADRLPEAYGHIAQPLQI